MCLIKSHQDISALRGELEVMNRLARAQDRKFEGSEGYAMARRLWAVEEDLRVARSTIASLGAEVGVGVGWVLPLAFALHLHGTAQITVRCTRRI